MLPSLYRASFGYLLRHPWQLWLALLGIATGVAVMLAVDLANASSRRAFLLSMDTLNGRATHQVVGGPSGIDEQVYVRLRVDDGLNAIAPIVQGEVESGSVALSVLGVDVFAEAGFRTWAAPGAAGDGGGLPRIRSLLTEGGSVLMNAATAALLGVEPGDKLPVTAGGLDRQASLVGLLEDPDGRLDNLLITDVATAQTWFDSLGRLTRIDVRVPEGSALADRIRSKLPAGLQLLDADSRTQATTAMTDAFMTNLTAMSLLAMLVGVFLIYNSVGFAVVQRRGLIGILRALGLTRGETFLLILLESIALGALGVLLGAAAGIWLGDALLALVSRSINDLYFRVSVNEVTLDGVSMLRGTLAGFGATLLAALVPAFEAAGFRPALALRRSVLEARTGRSVSLLAFAGVIAMAAAAVLLAFSGRSLVAGLVALFMLILGFAVGVPLAVRSTIPALARLGFRLGGTTVRMAIEGIAASLSRTGVAIVALAVAVSATVGVSVMVDSFREAVRNWLGDTLRSDIYVGVDDGTLDRSLVDELVAVPGIGEVSSSRRVWIESPLGRTRLIALSMASRSYDGTELLDAEPREVWPGFDAGELVLVSEPYAYRQQLGRGDSVMLQTTDGPREFEVGGVFRSYDANQGAVVMSRVAYDRYWSDDAIDSLGLYLEADADAAAVVARLRAIAEGRQALRISSNADIRRLSLQIFERTFVITNVLYWLAVGVAVIGILGAMLALQLERARELAVLRALGMTPREIGGMVTLQTTLIGILSGLAAVPLGLVMAWVLIDVINRRSFGWTMPIDVDPVVLASAFGLATGSAFLAGLYPAWRSAQSSPAEAIREE